MSKTHEQRIQDELVFQAQEAAKELAALKRTSDEIVAQYRDGKEWRINRVECLIQFLIRHKPALICDLGCGSGEMATRLGRMGFQVEGYDVSPDVIAVANKRAELDGVTDKVTFTVADGASDSLPKNKFDAVLAMSVIHHLPLEEGLRTLSDMLKPGGYIAIQEPVAYSNGLQWLRDRTPVKKEVSPDERQLGAYDIQRISEVFEIEEIRHFVIFHRFWRVLPKPLQGIFSAIALRLDALLMKIPGMSTFAGGVVILARETKCSQITVGDAHTFQ